jgi:ferritin-like metal-binding protein YciE
MLSESDLFLIRAMLAHNTNDTYSTIGSHLRKIFDGCHENDLQLKKMIEDHAEETIKVLRLLNDRIKNVEEILLNSGVACKYIDKLNKELPN